MRGIAGAAVLFGYCAFLGVVAPAALRRARWVTRAPGLAITLWQVLSASLLASFVLADLMLARPWLLRLVSANYLPVIGGAAGARNPAAGSVAIAVIAVVLAAGALLRLGCILAGELIRVRRVWRQHADVLAFAGRLAPGLDGTVIDHEIPAVYCLPVPDRRRRIVITSGALRVLDHAELDAVVEHEHAHLRGRHHLMTAVACALDRTFPGVPLLRHGRHEISILTEMAADDTAARRHDRATMATAMMRLAAVGTPAQALGAGGHTVTHRISRMLSPPEPLRFPGRAAGVAVAAGVFACPIGQACTTLAVLAVLVAGPVL